MVLIQLKEKFNEVFEIGNREIYTYFSPGRVNLIGEHIDYNGGMVLPVAINLGTYAVVALRNDRQVNLMSLNFENMGVLSFQLDRIAYNAEMGWANYPMGIFKTLSDMGHEASHGMDILYYGDLPNGAGLSSSASIEVLTATIIKEQFDLPISPEQIAVYSQKSENTFNGVNCGIMDQFAIAMGKTEHALLLNCDTLAYEHVPAELDDYRIVIINTNKKRGLVDSEYNARRAECESALSILKQSFNERTIHALCDLTPAEFLSVSESIQDSVVYKRAFHAIIENYRTLRSKEALSNGDLAAFGEWMYGSHESLRHNFEVSCFELDTVVDYCRGVRGVLGARMTGAGFGGCAIALTHKDHIDELMQGLSGHYHSMTGLEVDYYIAQISGGTKRVE